jgi:hypothetical protein
VLDTADQGFPGPQVRLGPARMTHCMRRLGAGHRLPRCRSAHLGVEDLRGGGGEPGGRPGGADLRSARRLGRGRTAGPPVQGCAAVPHLRRPVRDTPVRHRAPRPEAPPAASPGCRRRLTTATAEEARATPLPTSRCLHTASRHGAAARMVDSGSARAGDIDRGMELGWIHRPSRNRCTRSSRSPSTPHLRCCAAWSPRARTAVELSARGLRHALGAPQLGVKGSQVQMLSSRLAS